MTTSIAIIGAAGKMGLIVQHTLNNLKGYKTVAKIQRADDLKQQLLMHKPTVAIDVSSHLSVYAHAKTMIECGVKPLIGTSGLSLEQINELSGLCQQKKLGGIVAPNFSLGAAFIHKMVTELSQYYEDKSIVEFHHAQKKDKPSGTSRHTASLMKIDEGQIASVRSNSFLAKQQVFLSSPFERIVIDHESFDRQSYIKGIELCLRKIIELDYLAVGLENLI